MNYRTIGILNLNPIILAKFFSIRCFNNKMPFLSRDVAHWNIIVRCYKMEHKTHQINIIVNKVSFYFALVTLENSE